MRHRPERGRNALELRIFLRRRIATLSPYDVEQYFRRLTAHGAGKTTVRLVRALLHRPCRLAREWSGNTLPNPVTDTELPIWGRKEGPKRVRASDPDEYWPC
jgi:hypothetical protein